MLKSLEKMSKIIKIFGDRLKMGELGEMGEFFKNGGQIVIMGEMGDH